MILEPSSVSQLPAPLGVAVRKLLDLEPLDRHYREAQRLPAREFAGRMLALLGIRYELAARDWKHIPSSGPVILAANHPFGLLEGLLLYSLLPRIRQDFKVMANAVLHELPELHEHLIPVEIFDERRKAQANQRAFRRACQVLDRGGLLAIFPAGEVSSFRWNEAAVGDPAWSRSASWLSIRTGAPIVPFYFSGSNSAVFQIAGLLHPALRTLRLPAELLNKRGKTLEMRAGNPVPALELAAIQDPEKQAAYLRARSQVLAYREPSRPKLAPGAPFIAGDGQIARDVDRLPAGSRLASTGAFDTFVTRGSQSPAIVDEIGRLRAEAFREVGEGTGAPTDIDTFDAHYDHLFVWHREAREIVGAYRLAHSKEVLARQGVGGLYTSTLFRYQEGFFDRLGPALEVGRSFVRPSYQRQRAPLLMLWRGLAQCALRHSPVLFGAVSISGEYSEVSRLLLYRFLEQKAASDPLHPLVRARHPFRPAVRPGLWKNLAAGCGDLEQLSAVINDLEAEGRGVPVLIRQYSRLGARPLAFHVDRHFGHTLDCLITVDLRQAGEAALRPFLPDAHDRARLTGQPATGDRKPEEAACDALER